MSNPATTQKKIAQKEPEKPFLKWKYQFNPETGRTEFQSLALSDDHKIDVKKIEDAIQQATGSSSLTIGEKILKHISYGMGDDSIEVRMNNTSAMLTALKPQDETEAMLLGQYLALNDSGIKCLRNANSQEMFYHIEKLFSLATKLFNTANQTMQALLKYRSRGQQTLQVIHVHNEGQAIVAQNLTSHQKQGGATRENTVDELHGSL